MSRESDRARISKHSFGQLVRASFFGCECWNVGKYLGSMLYLDLGDRVPYKARDNQGIQHVGSCIISLYNVYWEVHVNGAIEITSEEIDDDRVFLIEEAICGRVLSGINQNSKHLIKLNFGENATLEVDLTNKWNEEGAILAFRKRSQDSIEISPKGYFFISRSGWNFEVAGS